MIKSQENLLKSCRAAIRKSLVKSLAGGGIYNTREQLLDYYDHARFLGRDVDSEYLDTTKAINQLCSMDSTGLIKLHKGAGQWSHYTFTKSILIEILDEIEEGK